MDGRKLSLLAPALFIMLAAAGLFSACGGNSSDAPTTSAETGSPDMQLQADKPVAFDRSFVITDRKTLDLIEPDFKVGALLYAVSRHLNAIAPDEAKKHTPEEFALNPFRMAAADVQKHNRLTAESPEAKVGTVSEIYNTYEKVLLDKDLFNPEAHVEPFRLIAVVNRLDLAGDFDMRGGGILAGVERKWFGEVRLVFSIKGVGGSTLPMTFIAEYRLPALKKVGGVTTLDKEFDFAAGPKDENDWRLRRQLWAKTWQDLSTKKPDDYVSSLRDILSWATYGTSFATKETEQDAMHHLAYRAGENVRDPMGNATAEFEYREFYLNDNWMLSTRKLRREPFACADQSKTLVDRIVKEWSIATNSMIWRYTLGERNLESDEIVDLKTACKGKLPYGQFDDKGDEKPGNDETQLRAKFSRFTSMSYWNPSSAERSPLSEAQKHSFALESCSGCHAAETGTTGFHIKPPAESASAAVLSKFLKGPTKFTPGQGRSSQSYDEPKRRMDLVAYFAAGGSGIDQPLLFDLGCKDVDVPCQPR